MLALFQIFLVLLLLNNVVLLWANQLMLLIRLVAFQGILLAGLLLVSPLGGGFDHFILAGAVLLIKGIGFPILLSRTFHHVSTDPHMIPRFGYGWTVFFGILGLFFSLWLEGQLPITPDLFPPLLLPAALTTLFSGLILVVGRTKALAQVIGYLVAENGIFLIGIPLMAEGAIWFELTILLDVFVAVFVMGIAINHINHTFESIDVGRFCSLRD